MDYFTLRLKKDLFVYLDVIESAKSVNRIIKSRYIYWNSNSKTSEVNLVSNLPSMDFLATKNRLPKYIFKASDWIGRGIVIDKRLYNKLGHLRWPKHICNPLAITYRKKVLTNYLHIYLLENSIKYCDWSKTRFFESKGELVQTEFSVKSVEELKSERIRRKNLYIETCNLSSSFPSYDVFGLFLVEDEIYFSKRFVDAVRDIDTDDVDFVSADRKIVFLLNS